MTTSTGAGDDRTLTRRQLLRGAGLGAAALATGSALSGCQVFSGTSRAGLSGSQANEVTGGFDWRRAAGTHLKLLLEKHPYTLAAQAELADFTRLTGITTEIAVYPESNYFDAVTITLLGGQSTYDVIMSGAYQIWQYGPPGWMENLDPWIHNPAATSPDYDYEDIFPFLRQATQWDFVPGHPLGTGHHLAIPWGWEANVIAYPADDFARLGLKPPGSLDELGEVAAAYQAKAPSIGRTSAYGLTVRGSRSWATVHPGFMSQFTREGGRDFRVGTNGKLTPAVNSPQSVAFHTRWLDIIKKSGPPGWTAYTYEQCAADLGARKAGMFYDATSASYPQNQSGASPVAGHLAWSPGPAGPGGSLADNLWTWTLAINSYSKKKLAAWLFLQWATGKSHQLTATVKHNAVDTVRQSVFADRRYQQKMSSNQGYLETLEAVQPHIKVQFTPEQQYFNVVTNWAATMEEIYLGANPRSSLDNLASYFSATATSAA